MNVTAYNAEEERTWAMLCHLIALTGYISGIGFIVGPLIVWLIKKDEYPLVDDQGKESLNFQISIIIYWIGLVVALFTIILIVPAVIGMCALAVFQLVGIIIASVRAKEGQHYRYPLTIRFFS